ncbi:hypothetical protein [Brevibacterium linens]|uniref:Uncharacterized protein n=1 Tax=Brevibacterium linens TaxID=1703 RepID=A0A2H1HI38_BRELN|nr:hypothetical protein [Brevibacterium linens]SMX62520.1 hypothetical protein BLIN101_00006 [Brevibacterium linens]
MSDTPRPTPTPGTNSGPNPGTTSAPTPASVSGDVPVETWRAGLAAAREAPAAERHGQLNSLLDDLDAQVGSL